LCGSHAARPWRLRGLSGRLKGETMSGDLSELENVGVGAVASGIQAVILQPTIYWKNAAQQGLPFTMNPKFLYRGMGASLANEMGQMGLQFGMTGYLRKVFGADGVQAELGTAIVGGALIGPYASLMECTMIQQQKYGGTLLGTPVRVFKEYGLRGLFRGVSVTIVRDALYVGGLLGITPVMQDYLRKEQGFSPLAAESVSSIGCGLFVGVATVPFDAISTVMKGDLTNKTGFIEMMRTRAKGGLKVMFAGGFFRAINIAGTIWIANAARTRIEPLVRANKHEAREVSAARAAVTSF